MSTEIEGMAELEAYITEMGKLPQKCVNTAARKGIAIVKKSAKQGGWVDGTGYLRKGIIQKAERTKTKGKKVYEVTMNAKMNDVFVKISKSGKRYYYPSSQEYGFKTKNGGYVPGFHFMRNALAENDTRVEQEIVNVLSKEIDKLK